MRFARVPRQSRRRPPTRPTCNVDVQPHRRAQRSSDLSDYTGQLQADTTVRVTDRDNDESPGGGNDPATVSDFPFPVTVPCVGDRRHRRSAATCALNDHLRRASCPARSRRATARSGSSDAVQVFDGGGDGLASTAPNTLFAKQGVFVP